MNGMGRFQYQFPTAEKILKIKGENQNNNHVLRKGSNINYFLVSI
jgi:hypothetical protein